MAARGLWPKLKSEQESNNNDEREGKRRSGGPREGGFAAWAGHRRWNGRRGLCDGLIRSLVRPGTDRRHQLIPQSRHGRDVGGVLRVVAEQTAERSHRLVDRIRSDDDVRPDLV